MQKKQTITRLSKSARIARRAQKSAEIRQNRRQIKAKIYDLMTAI